MVFFKSLFGGRNKEVELLTREFTEEEHNRDYELKEQGLEKVLVKMHGIVGLAIIPFSVGGAVDIYIISKIILRELDLQQWNY